MAIKIKMTNLLLFFSFGLIAQITPPPPTSTIKQASPQNEKQRLIESELESIVTNTIELTAQEILDKSIQYHDPENSWLTTKHLFHLRESRPDGRFSETDIIYSATEDYYSSQQKKGDNVIVQTIDKGTISYAINGEKNLEADTLKAHRLNPERSKFIKNYYIYLWGLPMKLEDRGTILGDVVKTVDFFGNQLVEIKVTYTKEVGHDIWYFYFDPSTYALRGYRFYHNEADNDGEYILLKGEATVGSMRLPAKRDWYTHKEAKFLGSDEIVE